MALTLFGEIATTSAGSELDGAVLAAFTAAVFAPLMMANEPEEIVLTLNPALPSVESATTSALMVEVTALEPATTLAVLPPPTIPTLPEPIVTAVDRITV